MPGWTTGSPVGPEPQEEIAVHLQRHAAQYVGQGSAKEDGEQRAGDAELGVAHSRHPV